MGGSPPTGFGPKPSGFFSTGEVFDVKIRSNPCPVGSRMMGTVFIKTGALGLPPVTLEIALLGNEKVLWTVKHGRDRRIIQDGCGLLNITRNVLRTAQPLNPGSFYQFDFGFDMPEQIPGSFKCVP